MTIFTRSEERPDRGAPSPDRGAPSPTGRSHRPRAIGILAAAAILVVGSYLASGILAGARSDAGPKAVDAAISIDGPGALPRVEAAPVPDSLAQIDRSITAWTANLAAEPRDHLSATTLATLHHARGRLTGDLGDQERALGFAREAARLAPTEAGGRSIQAVVLYTLHDFTGALTVAESLFRDDPTQLGALATMADAKLELGRIADARSDLDQLATLASGPSVDIRLARLALLTGQADEAVRLAVAARDRTAADLAIGGTGDLGFHEFAVGEYARLAGDAALARSRFEAALAIRSSDIGTLVGLARIDAFEGRTDEAIAGLQRAAAIAPQPETIALLGDVLQASGDAAGATTQFETVRFIKRLGEIQNTVFDRVLLRFEADHGGASDELLARARASVAARPDPSGHDALAWILYRLGRFDEAATEIAAASTDGATDARLRFHRGAIALALGDAAAGRADLEWALVLGPALDLAERAEAERLLGR